LIFDLLFKEISVCSPSIAIIELSAWLNDLFRSIIEDKVIIWVFILEPGPIMINLTKTVILSHFFKFTIRELLLTQYQPSQFLQTPRDLSILLILKLIIILFIIEIGVIVFGSCLLNLKEATARDKARDIIAQF
jgi:hypothetical protein